MFFPIKDNMSKSIVVECQSLLCFGPLHCNALFCCHCLCHCHCHLNNLIVSQPSGPLHGVPRVVSVTRFACGSSAAVNSRLCLDILWTEVVSCYSASKMPAFRPAWVFLLHLEQHLATLIRWKIQPFWACPPISVHPGQCCQYCSRLQQCGICCPPDRHMISGWN